ncbi:MAG: glycosyltransferase family 9 protein, partial [Candidatus Saganbacteria bacterium]|nr:glycosyltransferase family 9 protein [Candidatus Saganbacteria bacterium]
MAINPSLTKKVLIARTDVIGDTCLATVVLPSLRSFFPKAEITFLLRPLTRSLLEANPYINRVEIDKIASGKVKTKKDLQAYAEEIKKQNYDLFISLWENPIYKKLAKLAGIQHVYIAPSPGRDITKHQVERNFNALDYFGIPYTIPWELYITLNNCDTSFAISLLQKENISDSSLIISVSPGSSGRTKTWNLDYFLEVAEYFIKKHQAFILVHGSNKEKPAAQYLKNKLGDKIIDLTGVSVGEMAAAISKSHLYFGGDTGTSHLAAAFRVPSVFIYCEKLINPMRWGPWGTRHYMIYPVSQCPLKCRSLECKLNTCTKETPPEEIIALGEKLLAGEGINGKEEAMWYWKQKALRTLVICDSDHPLEKEKAEKISLLLKNDGFYSWLVSKNEFSLRNFKNLIKEITRTNTNVIHYFGKRTWLAKILTVLASNYVPHYPLLIPNKSDFNSAKDLIHYYTK